MKRKQLPEPYAAKRHPKGALDKIDVGIAIAFDQARPIGHTAVRVILQTSEVLPFSSFFMSSPPVIRAEATAAAVTNRVATTHQAQHFNPVPLRSPIRSLTCLNRSSRVAAAR